jgi:hypothetical protein
MAASCGGDPPLVAVGPCPLGVVPPPVHAAPSVWGPSSYVYRRPDPDESKGPTFPVRGACPAPVLPRGVAVPQIAGGSYFSLDRNPCPSHGGSHESGSGRDFASSASTAKQWHSFTLPGAIPDSVPSFVFGESHPHPFSLVRHPHAQASVALTLVSAASPLRPFAHEDSSSAFDLTMSFWPSSLAAVGGGVPSPLAMGDALLCQHMCHRELRVLLRQRWGGLSLLRSLPLWGAYQWGAFVLLHSWGAFLWGALSLIKCLFLISPWGVPHFPQLLDPWGVAFLPLWPLSQVFGLWSLSSYLLLKMQKVIWISRLQSIIQYYLRRPEFSTQRADNALVTDSTNAKASCLWEGQIRVTVQEGSLHFLFQIKGSLYEGKGFEMLDALNQHCRPDSVANAFTTLTLCSTIGWGTLKKLWHFAPILMVWSRT